VKAVGHGAEEQRGGARAERQQQERIGVPPVQQPLHPGVQFVRELLLFFDDLFQNGDARFHIKIRGLTVIERKLFSGLRCFDEATGFQRDRKHDALRLLLWKYIAEGLQKWLNTVPDSFFLELDKLYNNEPTASHKRPQYYGHFIGRVQMLMGN
jgi:hypothetical protein